MIRANELMIGDWVLTLDPTHEEKVQAQIWAIEEGQTSILVKKDITNWFVDIEWIEPIPLTPEILEENGFDRYGDNFIYEKVGLYIQIKLGAFVRVFCGMDNTVNFNRDFYVHTLQHALRLCGIEKEIEL